MLKAKCTKCKRVFELYAGKEGNKCPICEDGIIKKLC